MPKRSVAKHLFSRSRGLPFLQRAQKMRKNGAGKLSPKTHKTASKKIAKKSRHNLRASHKTTKTQKKIEKTLAPANQKHTASPMR